MEAHDEMGSYLERLSRVLGHADRRAGLMDYRRPMDCRSGRDAVRSPSHYLVDFFHVCEYLAPVTAYAQDASAAWMETQKTRLRNNDSHPVLTDLERCFEPANQPEAPARTCHRYLSARAHQLNYRGTILQKLPIGFGEIESAHRSIIQARLKRPRAWWKIKNAQSMIDLQALRHNGGWQQYWGCLQQAAYLPL